MHTYVYILPKPQAHRHRPASPGLHQPRELHCSEVACFVRRWCSHAPEYACRTVANSAEQRRSSTCLQMSPQRRRVLLRVGHGLANAAQRSAAQCGAVRCSAVHHSRCEWHVWIATSSRAAARAIEPCRCVVCCHARHRSMLLYAAAQHNRACSVAACLPASTSPYLNIPIASPVLAKSARIMIGWDAPVGTNAVDLRTRCSAGAFGTAAAQACAPAAPSPIPPSRARLGGASPEAPMESECSARSCSRSGTPRGDSRGDCIQNTPLRSTVSVCAVCARCVGVCGLRESCAGEGRRCAAVPHQLRSFTCTVLLL